MTYASHSALIAGLITSCAAFSAAAQPAAFPSKSINIIVPLPVGTASDLLARIVGEGLSKIYGQQVVVLNQPGAGGLIGSTALAKSEPDGYTLALIAPPHLIGPLMQSKAPYRPIEDITAVSHIASIPNVIVVSPNVPSRTLGELIELVRAEPRKFNYASFGEGTVGHIGAEILNLAGGLKAVHVPFKGLGPIASAMALGEVHYFVPATTTAVGLIRGSGGRLRPIAATSTKRSIAFPEVPTVSEAGFPAAAFDSWYGVAAPAGLPAEVLSKLNGDIRKILQEADTKEKFRRQDALLADDPSPAAFAALLKSEYARFQKLVKDAGIKPH